MDAATIRKNFGDLCTQVLSSTGLTIQYDGAKSKRPQPLNSGYSTTYPMIDDRGSKWVLKIWSKPCPKREKAYQLAENQRTCSEYFVESHYIASLFLAGEEISAALVAWQDGKTLQKWAKSGFGVAGSHVYETMAAKVVDLARYLQSENLLHQDIKAPNIMVTSTWELKLIDYDTLVDYEGSPLKPILGTPSYLHKDQVAKLNTQECIVNEDWDGFGFLVIVASLYLLAYCPNSVTPYMSVDDESMGISAEILHNQKLWDDFYRASQKEFHHYYIEKLNELNISTPDGAANIVLSEALPVSHVNKTTIGSIAQHASSVLQQTVQNVSSAIQTGAGYVRAKISPPKSRSEAQVTVPDRMKIAVPAHHQISNVISMPQRAAIAQPRARVRNFKAQQNSIAKINQ